MKKLLLFSAAIHLSLLFFFSPLLWRGAGGEVCSQPNNNGTLDNVEEFSTKFTIPFTMPDGIKLMTDVYVPIVQDCLMVHYDTIMVLGNAITDVNLQVLKKGSQVVIYDTLNGQPNPNPYQLPLIITRTPYGKGGNEAAGAMINLLGFSYAMQDMRGRYTSEGVYFPMFSDSWNKNPYHPDFSHIADVTPLTDPKNANKHEDGYNSIKYITDSLKVTFGNPASKDFLCNGSVGMFGASALANTQFQAAAAHHIEPYGPGLKCLLPIVGTNEHYKYTGFQNGVFRERIVTGWLKGQILDLTDELRDVDFDVQNDIHTSKDYNLPTKFDVAFKCIDHFSSQRYGTNLPGYYPNSKGRAEMDASHARVDANGEGDANGMYSRYTNSQVSTFNLTGWWDIFIDGQIETFEKMRYYCNDSLSHLQKLVIGPWAHQTIGTVKTGDMTYKKNVLDITKFNVDNVDPNNLPISDVLKSELVEWFRYTLNYNSWKNTGDPKFIIPESQDWQNFGAANSPFLIRIPSQDYKIKFEKLFNYLNGTQGLTGMKVDLKDKSTGIILPLTIDIPASGSSALPGLDTQHVTGVVPPDFSVEWKVPAVRFYVVGPNDDGISDNDTKGNYWFGYDKFPPDEVVNKKRIYMHQDGTLNWTKPTADEGFGIYVTDPDDPIKTVGGGNMIVKNPNGDGRNSQGQMNLADPTLAPYTMNRPGVIHFISPEITEANGYVGDSLCIIGFPVATVYAKSNPAGATSGPTDADFMVRILDVYPNGKEFFVVEGTVNARARDYAFTVAGNYDRDDTAFTNINIGQVYKYQFKMMPLAYTWGKNHKMKILISSANHPRYQANANIPINEGEFFRRQPLDGKTYSFNGQSMAPRIAVQRIAFSPDYPTQIILPVYETTYVGIKEEEKETSAALNVFVYPNPASDATGIYLSKNSKYKISITNIDGQQVFSTTISDDRLDIDVKKYSSGMYFIEAADLKSGEKKLQKFSVAR